MRGRQLVALASVHVSGFNQAELETCTGMTLAALYTFTGWLHSVHPDAIRMPASLHVCATALALNIVLPSTGLLEWCMHTHHLVDQAEADLLHR